MKINGTHHQSISLTDKGISVLDQRLLPWQIKFVELTTFEDCLTAIKQMWVRGAPLIGAVGAFGLSFGLREGMDINFAAKVLAESRPTAINLNWALERLKSQVVGDWEQAYRLAYEIALEDAELNRRIGLHGLELIKAQAKSGSAVQILTHCNAGWLATMDYGTALAPIYLAHSEGIDLHVWVDETRPRNQGSLLTAFELMQQGIPHTVISDNAGGLLMQRGEVDLCLVGADRVTQNGDVCNKIGTYLKALAAKAHQVPFYVALPYSTLDPALESGSLIPIEERSPDEVIFQSGLQPNGQSATLKTTLSQAYNPAFDITPSDLVTAYITEEGVFDLSGLQSKYRLQ
jgi:methylthioribose-1-phosphate isomerase